MGHGLAMGQDPQNPLVNHKITIKMRYFIGYDCQMSIGRLMIHWPKMRFSYSLYMLIY